MRLRVVRYRSPKAMGRVMVFCFSTAQEDTMASARPFRPVQVLKKRSNRVGLRSMNLGKSTRRQTQAVHFRRGS